MKYKIHIPTEQYGFVEYETDTREDAVAEYEKLSSSFATQNFWNGVNASWRDLEFNKTLDSYLLSSTMSADDYAQLDTAQKMLLQVVKRAFARINKE